MKHAQQVTQTAAIYSHCGTSPIQSDENVQNSEPSLAISADKQKVAVSAFEPAFQNNPIFTSANGGVNWNQFANNRYPHHDVTLEWSPGGTAYAAFNALNGSQMFVSQSGSPETGAPYTPTVPAAPYPAIGANGSTDQPWLDIVRRNNVDRCYVGFQDKVRPTPDPNPRAEASVRYSTNCSTNWTNVKIERTNPGIFNGAAARVAAVPGTDRVYAVFHRLNSNAPDCTDSNCSTVATEHDFQGDVVIVRDDDAGNGNAGAGVLPFGRLGNLGNGYSIAVNNAVGLGNNIDIPYNRTFLGRFAQSGKERLGSDLSLVARPAAGDRPEAVFVAYTHGTGASEHLHVAKSANGGSVWEDIFITNVTGEPAALPALAVADNGCLGLLYTAFNNNKLESRLTRTCDDFLTRQDNLLLRFPDNGNPGAAFQPYIGDYQDLEAIGNDFFGTFSASNNPRQIELGAGVNLTFPRNTAGCAQVPDPAGANCRLVGLNVSDNVNPSIDPYFFSAAAVPEPGTLSLLLLGGLTLLRRLRAARGSPAASCT